MTGAKTGQSPWDESQLLRFLADSCGEWRPIVPLLGAGISVDSGFPVPTSIVRYLAKVQYFFRKQLYEPPRAKDEVDLNYSKEQYLSLFGWPDPFDLNDRLWAADLSPDQIEKRIDQSYKDGWAALHPKEMGRFDAMYALLQGSTEKKFRRLLHAAERRKRLSAEQRETLEEFRRSRISPPGWRSFLRWVSDNNADNVDNLFRMFNRGRMPGDTHRFLAFLARKQNWKLVLTTNFDDLIERAMRSEGLSPIVYDVSRSAELPNELLVGADLSILKLHGSAYGLRVGETLDDPMPAHEKKKLLSYIPEDALLLVMGYGGNDRRIMDLIESVLRRGGHADEPVIAWAHFEPEVPKAVVEMLSRSGTKASEGRLVSARTYDFGALLVSLYARLTSSHPTSEESYSAPSERPISLISAKIIGAPAAESETAESRRPVHVFSGETSGPECESIDATSIAMSEFLSRHGSTHRPIWLNSGLVQSIEEIVAKVMQQCHKHDPSLPAVALLLGGSLSSSPKQEDLARAAKRVLATLRRGSYILAIDEVGSFGRPPTTHHGLPYSCAGDLKGKMHAFFTFLKLLVDRAEDCKDSYICLSISDVPQRFVQADRGVIDKQMDDFKAISDELSLFRCEMAQRHERGERVQVHEVRCRRGHSHEESDARARLVEALAGRPGKTVLTDAEMRLRLDDLDMLIATFRRPRDLVALRRLAVEYLDDSPASGSEVVPTNRLYEYLDLWLDWMRERGLLSAIGAELYWMRTSERDKIYEKGSCLATGIDFFKALEAPESAFDFMGLLYDGQKFDRPDLLRPIVRQLCRLIFQQREVARYYYSDLFLASKDVTAYSEYIYHRISSIRYATALSALLATRKGELQADSAVKAAWGSDPVGRFTARRLSDELRRGPKARLNDIVSLKRTLERDRDLLLSRVPSDTLVGWVEWIVPRDLPRFLIAHYGGTESSRDGIEGRIKEQVWELEAVLRDLHGKVLREKTDYEGCIRARLDQIHHLLRQPDDKAFRVLGAALASGAPGSASMIDRILVRIRARLDELRQTRARPQELRAMTVALGAVLDIAVCLGGLDRHYESAAIIARLRSEVEATRAQGADDPWFDKLVEVSEVRLHFRAAALVLSTVGYWDVKNDGTPAQDLLKLECKRALKECDQGLGLINETNTEPHDYFVYRSYLRTLRARALALWSRFTAAFRDFDRALAGLDLGTGSGRGAAAIRTLWFAEALTFYSDFRIMRMRKWIPRRFDAIFLSPQGRLLIGFNALLGSLVPKGVDVAGSTRHFIRQAMTPWADLLDSRPEAFVRNVRQAMGVMVEANPGLGPDQHRALEILGEDSRRLSDAWKALPTPCPDEVKLALRRSLAYRNLEQIGSDAREGSASEEDLDSRKALRSAMRSLERARSELIQVESLLSGGRRDSQFWLLLHRQRAQLHFEELLMALTVGPTPRSGPDPDGTQWKSDQERFQARFAESAFASLRALRDARDHLLTRETLPESGDSRLVNLRQLEYQVLLACACNAAIRETEPGEGAPRSAAAFDDASWVRFWNRWNWLLRTSGVDTPSDQPRARDVYLRSVMDSFRVGSGRSLAVRAFVERHLKIVGYRMIPVRELG